MRFILIILLCSLPLAAHAKYRVKETPKHQNIAQPNPHKLLPTIKRTMARYCKGTSAHSVACAISKTDVKWKIIEKPKGKCRIKDVNLTLTVTYHLPRWQSYSRQTQDIKVQWRQLKKDIFDHEKHHGAISKKHMKNAYNEIIKLKGSCDNLTDQANAIFDKHNNKARQEHKNFDARDSRTRVNFPD